ncbi:hypothetical protein [Ascidiimonas aurantiaca]|uniref:hypothetical protein n=1 Tax=Ascidiimonas aurantiaca TaxID=1685432 RepID=UPI0030EF54CC
MNKKEVHKFSIDHEKCEIHYDNDIMKALDITIRVPKDFSFSDIDGNGTFWKVENGKLIIYLSGPVDNAAYRAKLKSICGYIPELAILNYDINNPFGFYIQLVHAEKGFLPKTVGGSTVVGLG